MKLYGTITSPFVRRVRVVVSELGLEHTLVDTSTAEGQAALKTLTPIWKVPIADFGDRLVFDSRVIIDWLTMTHGWGPLEPPRDRWREANLVNAIDGALESGIQLFYLKREGVDLTGVPFGQRQLDRITSVLGWIGGELGKGGFGEGLGLPELALVTTLDWFDFRAVYPTDRHAVEFVNLREALGARPSLVRTRPALPRS